jgi:hypothetical protein
VIALKARFAHNDNPVAVAQIPSKTVTGLGTTTFAAEGLATDSDDDDLTITAIVTAPNSEYATVNAKMDNNLAIAGDCASTYGETLTTSDLTSTGGNDESITWSYGIGTSPSTWTTFELSGIGSFTLDAGIYTIKAQQAESAAMNSATVTETFVIVKKEISIDTTNSVIAAKTYDGTTSASITAVAFTPLAYSETFTLGDDYTISGAAYNAADVANATTVTATVTLVANGAVSKNYRLTSGSFSKAATINPQAIANGGTDSDNVADVNAANPAPTPDPLSTEEGAVPDVEQENAAPNIGTQQDNEESVSPSEESEELPPEESEENPPQETGSGSGQGSADSPNFPEATDAFAADDGEQLEDANDNNDSVVPFVVATGAVSAAGTASAAGIGHLARIGKLKKLRKLMKLRKPK